MSNDAALTLTLDSRDEALHLLGSRDQHLRLIREALPVRLVARGDLILIEGPAERVDQANRVFQQLRLLLRQQGSLTADNVREVLAVVGSADNHEGPQNLAVIEGGRHVRPRTDGQARYVHA